jgi:dipeptidyl aminopeptidase/acylaminoacyl peptidase
MGTAQLKRAITPQDCVTVRYLNGDTIHPALQVNPQGTRLAYVVKNPNLESNVNDIQLFVKDMTDAPDSAARLVSTSEVISQIHWLKDGEHMLALSKEGSHVAVINFDVLTGKRELVAGSDIDIKEFSVDSLGDTIVFATEDSQDAQIEKPTSKQLAEGYRIPFQTTDKAAGSPQRRLFITRRSDVGIWSRPQDIVVRSPFSGRELTSFGFTPCLRLSLSPDGKNLAFTYFVGETVPKDWSNSPTGRQILDNGAPIMTVLLVDLTTMEGRLPFKTTWAFSIPVWSADGKSFAIVATSPIGSEWEQADARDHRDESGAAHLFTVEPDAGLIEEVVPHVDNILRGPLWWGADGHMQVQTEENTITRLAHNEGVWRKTGVSHLSLDFGSHLWSLVSDDSNIIAEQEGPNLPPQLIWYKHGNQQSISLAKLDPQFDSLSLASARRVEWATSTGYKIGGLLLLPPDYVEGKAYPLVIQAYHTPERFFCDSGVGHWPSLAPQPLANAGIMYLIRTGSDDDKEQDTAHVPKQYPGGIGEAALQMDIWDSAVQTFAARGWIDPTRVGIVGFSRTGWYTEFTLAHSKVSYAAATATDNITYSLGTYWLIHSEGAIRSYDAMYGGPPYLKTQENWQKYSISFNVNKIHTPLLMEEMGYGALYDDALRPPLNLTAHFELFTGLNRLDKPVELYYYPLEEHAPDHPQARLASLQRNVDWYRFWLQGFERPGAQDPDQYVRWEHLRVLQNREKNNGKSDKRAGQ